MKPRNLPYPGFRLTAALLLSFHPMAAGVEAQVPAQLQGGLVHGVVREAGSGQPIPVALVMITERGVRLFTSDMGRFSIPGLTPGEYLVDLRQIGYAPASFRIRVTGGDPQPQTPPLILELVRQPLVLPTVTVTAPKCLDPKERPREGSSSAILDQLLTNAERLLAMESEYPVEARFERLRAEIGAADSVLWFRWDTTRTQTGQNQGYRRGRVLAGARNRPTTINYFTTSDIVGREFQENHCLWVSGEESIDGAQLIRIDFAPAEKLSSADWAGALYLDPVSGLLRRSEATLTRVPSNRSGLRSTRCEVSYIEIVPTLVHEKNAECKTLISNDRDTTLREVWQLLSWRFTNRVPGGS